MALLEGIRDFVWGAPLIIFLLGTGLFLTIYFRGLQFRYWVYPWQILFSSQRKKEGDISPFQALSTALSATVGIGNIAGVAGAILLGGPGALFWMWVSALLGMILKYLEAFLAVYFREKTPQGYAGGAMYYLKKGANLPFLASFFAIATAISALGIGNMAQINTAVSALERSSLKIPSFFSTPLITFLIALVIIGGIKRIGKVTQFFTPFMALFYLIGGILILSQVPPTILQKSIEQIFSYAFTPIAGGVGVGIGFLLFAPAIQNGIRRGLFSNEAGLGSAGIAHGSSKIDHPVKQGLVALLGPFIDTLIICSLTGIVIIATLNMYQEEILSILIEKKAFLKEELGVFLNFWKESKDFWASFYQSFGKKAEYFQDILILSIFTYTLGAWGEWVVVGGLLFFSTSTILGWYHYGDRAALFLKGEKGVKIYRVVYVLATFLGGFLNLKIVWIFSEIANAFMAFPNLVALIYLAPLARKETKIFFDRYPHRYDFWILFYLFFLKILPKRSLSKLFGVLSRTPLPSFVMIPILLAYAKFFRVNLEEAELELKDYKALNRFFIRTLKDAARYIEKGKGIIVSPVDGTIISLGKVQNGKIFQIKGVEIPTEELLGDKKYASLFEEGIYITIYLSPRDYHRIHAPYSGEVIGYLYKPGKLYPVNFTAVRFIKRLFSKNERLITFIKTPHGMMALVKIGATMVGKIKVSYDKKISTNRIIRRKKIHFYEKPIPIEKGEEIGRFEMGSTVILFVERGKAELLTLEERQKVHYGEAIAYFKEED